MAKATDPVCGMEVDTDRTPHKAVYKGKVYYFCSARCRREFEANPEVYIREGPRGMPSR
ncbi:MAG: YHS domain-containing protein [Thermofilum sp.]